LAVVLVVALAQPLAALMSLLQILILADLAVLVVVLNGMVLAVLEHQVRVLLVD
jgi:hypothetical protein